MKNKLFPAIILTVILAAGSVSASTSIIQSGTSNVVNIYSDELLPFDILPIIVLKPNITKEDYEQALNDGKDITDKVNYLGTVAANAEGVAESYISLDKGYTVGETYEFLVGDRAARIKYLSNEQRLSIIRELLSADISGVRRILADDGDALSLNTDLYEQADINTAAGILYEDLKTSRITPEDENAIEDMAKIINKAMVVDLANNNKLTDKAIIDDFFTGGEYKAVNDALKDKITDSGIKSYITDVQKKGYSDSKAAETQFIKELVLKAICYPKIKTSAELVNLITNYADTLGLNLNKFNTLSGNAKGEVMIALNSKCPSLNNIQTELDALVNKIASSENTNYTSGGGGGGGGASSGEFSGVTGGAQSGSVSSDKVFDDLDDWGWARDSILNLNSIGIINGYENGKFMPSNPITREEFVTIIVNAFFKDTALSDISFNDVDETAWYCKYIKKAVYAGIISGISDDCFGVEQNITRQDIAAILMRVANGAISSSGNAEKFDDDDDISDYAKNAVYSLRENGVINGVSENEFAPKKNATRAEAAVMIDRFMKAIGR